MSSKVQFLRDYVAEDLANLCVAHDFYHIDRVDHLAGFLAGKEWIHNLDVVHAGALCHEFFDEKFFSQKELIVRSQTLPILLEKFWFIHEEIAAILFIAHNVWYGKSLERNETFQMNPELAVVEDADRLESIWAIAIARTFTYGGKKSRAIYDPYELPGLPTDQQSYHNSSFSSIHHFYEKLLLLKDLLHTDSAREIAKTRHEFMELFLKQFYLEWNLEDLNV